MRLPLKHWRESASLIALVRDARVTRPTESDYRMLLQRRSDKSGFLPSTVVFPGGTAEECDHGTEWYDHFGSFGFTEKHFGSFQFDDCMLPPILQDESDPFKKHISLRITAIREAFEELGLLICKQNNKEPKYNYAQYLADFDVGYWQKKVHSDPLEFISLCRNLNCYPDIWSLHLWSNWLTPIGYESQRFDTIFFICAFESTPPLFADNKEVSEVWWSTPEEVISDFKDKKIILPPPQWYELSRLRHRKKIEPLIEFSALRSPLGCEQIYPILAHPTKGKGWLALFPGDELYPFEPDYKHQTVISLPNKTIDELQSSANVTHRMELYDLYTMKMQLKNFKPFQYQLSPTDSAMPDIRKYLQESKIAQEIY